MSLYLLIQHFFCCAPDLPLASHRVGMFRAGSPLWKVIHNVFKARILSRKKYDRSFFFLFGRLYLLPPGCPCSAGCPHSPSGRWPHEGNVNFNRLKCYQSFFMKSTFSTNSSTSQGTGMLDILAGSKVCFSFSNQSLQFGPKALPVIFIGLV